MCHESDFEDPMGDTILCLHQGRHSRFGLGFDGIILGKLGQQNGHIGEIAAVVGTDVMKSAQRHGLRRGLGRFLRDRRPTAIFDRQ